MNRLSRQSSLRSKCEVIGFVSLLDHPLCTLLVRLGTSTASTDVPGLLSISSGEKFTVINVL